MVFKEHFRNSDHADVTQLLNDGGKFAGQSSEDIRCHDEALISDIS